MTQQQNKKPKRLRDVYNADPEARAFLEKHPEFAGNMLEQSEVANPGFNTKEGKYTLNEVRQDLQEYGDIMLQAAAALPDNHVYKEFLNDYYNGITFSDLKKKYGAKTRNALNQRLFRARKAALKAYNKTRFIGLDGLTPLETRVFSYNGETRFVYLIRTAEGGSWVGEDGRSLPDYAQDILSFEEDV